MTREQNLLIKKLKSLSPDEIACVQQFLEQMKSPQARVAPLSVDGAGAGARAGRTTSESVPGESPRGAANAVAINGAAVNDAGVNGVASSGAAADGAAADGAAADGAAANGSISNVDAANAAAANPDAEVARAAGDGWRRRPFQEIDAEDLQPIAVLFRQAVEFRAASRFRYGSR